MSDCRARLGRRRNAKTQAAVVLSKWRVATLTSAASMVLRSASSFSATSRLDSAGHTLGTPPSTLRGRLRLDQSARPSWRAGRRPVHLVASLAPHIAAYGSRQTATDLAESFWAGLSSHLDHAVRVADPFHVVRVRNRCLDKVPPPGPERDAGPPRPQGRSALSHPEAVADGRRAPRRTGRAADAAGSAHRRSPRRGAGRMAGQGIGSRGVLTEIPPSPPPSSTRPSPAAPPTTWRRSDPSAPPWHRGAPRSWPTTAPAPATVPRRA